MEATHLVSDQKTTDGVFLRYPFRIRLDDSTLYIMDLHGSDNYCHRFSYPAIKHQSSFCKRGDGPGELLDAENIRIDSKNRLWTLDANRKKMICISGDSVQQEIPLAENLIRTLDFDLYNDSLFIVPDYTGKYRFSIIDHHGNIIKNKDRIPIQEKNKQISDMALAQAWRSFLNYNPKNNILAMVTQLGEVLEIYDLKGDSTIKVFSGKFGKPIFKYNGGYAIPNGIMGYSDVYVGTNYIYAIFWGHSFEDIKRGTVKVEGGNTIHVFDLKGKPVMKYELDRYITGFCVNEESHKILGLDVNKDQQLVEYVLPKI
ncbi:MAG: BF3164 family lipoprotein [Bacteroidales bacterium]|nr:BF3164 family lipoprotein [Bacteroidales bacterium]